MAASRLKAVAELEPKPNRARTASDAAGVGELPALASGWDTRGWVRRVRHAEVRLHTLGPRINIHAVAVQGRGYTAVRLEGPQLVPSAAAVAGVEGCECEPRPEPGGALALAVCDRQRFAGGGLLRQIKRIYMTMSVRN